MCLHITFIHSLVWLWFAAWPASMITLCFSTDQMASLMAEDDDTGWSFFHCCFKTISWHKTTFRVRHSFVPFNNTNRMKGKKFLWCSHHSYMWQVTFSFCLLNRFALRLAFLFDCVCSEGPGPWSTRETLVKQWMIDDSGELSFDKKWEVKGSDESKITGWGL